MTANSSNIVVNLRNSIEKPKAVSAGSLELPSETAYS